MDGTATCDVARVAPARPGCSPTRRTPATRSARRLGALVALVTLTASGPGALALDPPNTPTRRRSACWAPGYVRTIVPRGDVTYIGGNFDELAAVTGAFARLEPRAGGGARRWRSPGGEVRASVPDGNGGFYIGGTFTSLGGEPRRGIGHILANGSVDPNFSPDVLGDEQRRPRARAVRRWPDLVRRRQLHVDRRPDRATISRRSRPPPAG